ncbi:MAG: UDP-glucose/GDP-mannose dehydrogenase family protein, partial [Armatimonadetes bacterium]|nr:UDP-glucose/GDP-mannose dehydrogenase family protein [Armatimonadota bacterium]
IATARKYGYDFDLLRSVVAINDAQPILFVKRIVEAFGGCICGKRFGILGLAFKPNTDDMREAKALELIRALRGHGGSVCAYDPVAEANARLLAPDLECVESAYAAAENADALVVVTEWNEFKELDLDRLRGLMRRPLICDARNLYDPGVLSEHGLEHIGIGRGAT